MTIAGPKQWREGLNPSHNLWRREIKLVDLALIVTILLLIVTNFATSEERYRHLVPLSFEAIIIHTIGEILDLNPAGMALFGFKSAQDLQGKSFLDFTHPDERDAVRSSLQQEQIQIQVINRGEEQLLPAVLKQQILFCIAKR